MGMRAFIGRVRRIVLSPGFFLTHVLIPLGLMIVYFGLSSFLLPAGVNQVFVSRSAKYALPFALLIGAAFFAMVTWKRLPLGISPTAGDGPSAGDLILLLFPLAPVSQYLLNNKDILPSRDAALVLGLFALLGAIPIIVVPALLRKTGAARPAMYLGLAFAFMIANMADMTSQFGWHGWGSLKIQLPIFVGVWLLSWLLFRRGSQDLMHAAIAIYFVASVLLQGYASEATQLGAETEDGALSLGALIGSRGPILTPSIYLLVYDAYVVNETMLAYGLDNRAQEQYLQEQGFRMYPRTYSVGGTSVTSMNLVLGCSMSYNSERERRAVSGNGTVQNLLQGFGYRTYGVFPSDYFFRGIIPSYDYSFPDRGSSSGLLAKAILEGEFRFDMGFDDVPRARFLFEKEAVLTEASEAPRFVYSHSTSPGHSQNSGACLPDEIKLYGQRVAKANLEMRDDVEAILHHDPQAIVIVAGDHGPALTKNCYFTADEFLISEISRLDLQDRFGAFLAIRWPTEDYREYDDIAILQDVFPSILAYMFADASLLESRLEQETLSAKLITSGAEVVRGVIVGGIDDGEPLFLSEAEK